MKSPLTGKELLKKINDAGWGANHDPKIDKRELVISWGYVSKKDDGSEKVDYMAFTEASMTAEMELGESPEYEDQESAATTTATNFSKDKKSKLSISGTGIMLCIYEISQEDYKKFKSQFQEGELDYEQLKIGWDEGDKVAPYFEPSINLDGEDINLSKSLESLGCKLRRSEDEVTQKDHFGLSV